MKSIYSKIKVSNSLIFLILLSLVSGLFWEISIFLVTIFIHEMGHIVISLLYNWKVKYVKFSICGGYIEYDDIIDKPFKEEFFIAISGFCFQSILFFIIFILYKSNLISLDILLLFKKYYLSILIFNLLPIIPLDGSKIINIILNMFFSYKMSLKILSVISLSTIFIIIFLVFSLNITIEYSYIMIFSFLIKSIISYIKHIPYLFNKFLFQRYSYPIKSNKYICIKKYDVSLMKRQKKHYFIRNNKWVKESTLLSKRFD